MNQITKVWMTSDSNSKECRNTANKFLKKLKPEQIKDIQFAATTDDYNVFIVYTEDENTEKMNEFNRKYF